MKPALIGLTGRKYAGKTEAARILARYGYEGADIAITDPMIAMAEPLLAAMGITSDRIDQYLSPTGTAKDAPLPGFPWLTGRKILQAIGKDLRDALSRPIESDDHTANATDRRLFYDLWDERLKNATHKVNASVRYPFERDIIKERGGVVWRIVNPEAPEQSDEHASERQDWAVDHTIIAPHSRGLAYLEQQIDQALEEHN